MDSEDREFLKIILEEIRRINTHRDVIRPLSNAKADMEAAMYAHSRINVYTASVSIKDTIKMGEAMLPIKSQNLSPEALEREKSRRKQDFERVSGQIKREYETARRRELFARARYAISYMHKNGFSINQMESMVRNPGKKFIFPKRFPMALKFVKKIPQIRIKR